ncbi:phosphatidylglycerophosphatase A family protein [Methylomicrobium sp. RS1]|jgi:phosphatidylglycerophosphatase A|uniref:phosphatidylglycerophosphatase A family protein n=1 Tax=Candidatus Methylomicrobium oryzae TaxID=2802053 RepID=UPI001922F3C8|nr:phosphatidylglycerophosphatase A [Methylomicrobium sp. RS1]MBL1262649.1 phosphatidylglycerophosphatase A [Methylomicrobium sp. RS1]
MNIFHKTGLGRNQLTARQIMTDPVLFLAFGFGSGLARKAPGTFGTAAAIPLYWLFVQMGLPVYSVLTAAAILAGIPICGIAAEKLGEHDFNGIVWDEVAGLLITMWLVPFSWEALLLGFVLFRIFDILKPWPIKWIDRKVMGGLGIMLDDVLAAVFAGALLWAAAQQGWL